MKVKTKKIVTTKVTVEMSHDEAQYLHALTYTPADIAEAAGWSKKEEDWNEVVGVIARLHNTLDEEIF